MYQLIKPILFLLSPEKAHGLTVALLKFVLAIPGVNSLFRAWLKSPGGTGVDLFGLHFPNPVGLAAGFDKDGKYMHAMSALGFGFLELGTVTPKPQAGNPTPRLFRLPADHALINRMGFNNEGVDALVERLKRRRPEGVIIGGNIGKNKVTPNEDAYRDYEYAFKQLFPHVDYFVVNVSSPNTPNLRELQEKEPLTRLLNALQVLNRQMPAPKPILLKIAPDLTNSQLDDIIEIANTTGLAGLIATNTTIGRGGLSAGSREIEKIGPGGLSGRPLRERSTEVIRYISERTQRQLPIIGVGGIESAEDALEKIEAGARLVQVYSGLVYAGPTLIRDINKALATR